MEEAERTVRTNILGHVLSLAGCAAGAEAGGVILNTTSIEAFTPRRILLVYAATKAAIANLTKSLAKLASKQKGVRVNGIAPGPVWTPLIPSTMPAEKVKSFGQNTVFERPAQPIELAKLFVFAASEDAGYCSGEIFGATGGRTPL